MNTIPFRPMRPGVTLSGIDQAADIVGWLWQPKYDDERAVITPDGRVWTRFGKPFSPRKLPPNLTKHPGEALDVLLIGFRTGEKPRRWLIVDRPDRPGPYWQRMLNLPAAMVPPGRSTAKEAWELARSIPGTEGIVGRRVLAPYCQGDSSDMVKIKWRKNI